MGSASSAAAPKRARPSFTPVPSRARQDGWTPDRQVEFIEALAECGCVAEACRRVDMSDTAAYRLRARPTAQSSRQAWDVALETAIRRLSDAAFSRALHGVAQPIFYKPVLSACLGRQSKGASRSASAAIMTSG